MLTDVEVKQGKKSERVERTPCNFQQLFKIQMIKRQRKVTHLSTLPQESEGQRALQIKESSNKIVNLLFHFPPKKKDGKQSPLVSSRNTPTAPSLHFKKDPLLVNSLKGCKKAEDVGGSHSQIRVCDGVWRIKQLNKAFDREKLSLLQRYKGKMRRRVFSTEASNLLGTSISPLSKDPLKRISATRHHTKEAHTKTSFRYKDIPISQFIYQSNLTKSQSTINRGIQKRLEQICRRKNSRTMDHLSLQL